MVKRPIDVERDSAFSMTVGSADEGEIVAGISVGDALYTIKKRAIYRITLADQIDPERTNIAIPHVNQLVTRVGSDSLIVSRTLLTAHTLLRKERLPTTVNDEQGLKLYVDLMQSVLAAQDICGKLATDQENAEKQAHSVERRTLALPALGDVSARAKTFIQAAEHSVQILFKICEVFFRHDDMKANGPMFDGFVGLMAKLYGKDDPQLSYFREFAEFGRFMRNLRNCVEHPDSSKKITTSDYTLTARGEVRRPTIEIVHPMSPVHSATLLPLMSEVLDGLLFHSEQLLVHICAKLVDGSGSFDVRVGQAAAPDNSEPSVRYEYQINLGGEWHRLG